MVSRRPNGRRIPALPNSQPRNATHPNYDSPLDDEHFDEDFEATTASSVSTPGDSTILPPMNPFLESTIWATTASDGLSNGIVSTVRDASRSRERPSHLGSLADTSTARSGQSTSLFPSPDAAGWNGQLSQWPSAPMQSSLYPRSNGVSPSRQRSSQATPHSQSAFEGAAQSFTSYRTPLPQQSGMNPLAPLLDSNTRLLRNGDATPGGSITALPAAGNDPNHTPPTTNPWVEAGEFNYQPPDDRRSVTNPDHFGTHSAAGSRNGSLPPSRHGADSGGFSKQADDFSRFPPASSQQSSVRQSSAISGQAYGRRYNGSPNFLENEVAMLNRLRIEGGIDRSSSLHKPALSVNGARPGSTAQGPEPHDLRYARASLPDILQPFNDGSFNAAGSFTPEGQPASLAQFNNHHDHLSNLRNPYRNGAAGNRGAWTPNGDALRNGTYCSTGSTPPTHDQPHHRHDLTNLPSTGPSGHQHRSLSYGNSSLLERKLRGLELDQSRVAASPPSKISSSTAYANYLQKNAQNSYHQQMSQGQRIGGSPHLNGYASTQYSVPLSMQSNAGTGSSMSMQHLNGMQNMNGMMHLMPVEIPKGPREQEGSVGLRSALLEEFINTWKFRKWELKDMRHHVVEFSGHQLASRQIQDKLGSSNSEEKSRFFEELLPNATQLMADVFGNYVIQKLFEHCDQNQKKLLAMEMKTHVVSLSVQMYGCRVVQKALEHILVDQQAELIKELDGHVLRCVKDQNGNHVVQKAIERIPSEHIQFIADAFTGQVGQLAKHSYGCRVIQRMLERCDDRTKRTLLNELHGEGDRLIADQYGNYVTQHAIEHGSPEDRTKIITHVKTRILMFSRHKFASNVVEKCLVHGTSAQRHEMMLRILEQCPRNPGVASNEALFQLLKDAYGNYVVQKLLDTVDDEDYELFAAQCIPEMPRVKEFAQGKQVQALDEKLHQRALYRAMPTLTPSGSGTPPLEDDTQSPDGVSNPSPREDMHIALSMRPELNGKASAGIQAQFSVPDIGVEPFPEPDSDPDSS